MSKVQVKNEIHQINIKNPNLGVPRLMFESHEKNTSHLACQGATAGLQFYVQIRQAGTDTPLEIEDCRMRWPVFVLLRDLRMQLLSCIRKEIETRMAMAAYITLCGAIHIRVYATFKNILCRVRMSPKFNLNRRRTLKISGSVFGSPKRLDKWTSRNVGI